MSEASPGALARRLFERTRAFHGPAAFVLGFGYDALTLRRIDKLSDNLFLLAYLLLLGLALVFERRLVWQRWVPGFVARHGRWVPLATQFLFGGLFSAYVVFYFKSAAPGRSLVYLALLFSLMVLNEFRDRWLGMEPVRVALYFFCAYSFLLFFIPVITGTISVVWSVVAGIVASWLCAAVVVAIHFQARPDVPPSLPEELAEKALEPLLVRPDETTSRRRTPRRLTAPGWVRVLLTHAAVWGGLWFTLGALTCLGLVPPVPLSLTRIEVFHDIDREGGDFVGTRESMGWTAWLPWRDPAVGWRPGEGVVCFSAVFAPRGAQVELVHQWQFLDEERGWLDVDQIPVEISGGREGGFRTYTRKRNVRAGVWRVRVKTSAGQELGWLRFDVALVDEGKARDFESVRL